MSLVIFSNKLNPDYEDYGQTNQPIKRKNIILEKLSNAGIKASEESKYPAPGGQGNFVFIVDCTQNTIDELLLADVHDSDYLDFLKKSYESFSKSNDISWTGLANDLIPCNFFKTKPCDKLPIYKLAGFYGSDIMTPISANTWTNALISASQASKAAEHLYNNPCDIVYALTTSPGHHAKWSEYGGYCFINNAAVAARTLVELIGPAKYFVENTEAIGILDLDYHAGNGTDNIINKKNLWWCHKIFAYSLHCDPVYDYPSYEGYDDDYNWALPPHCTWDKYAVYLEKALQILVCKNITYLIIAFGGDTFKEDFDAISIGRFDLDISSYVLMGKLIRKYFSLVPIMITQEGGYNMEFIGEIVSAFISGLM